MNKKLTQFLIAAVGLVLFSCSKKKELQEVEPTVNLPWAIPDDGTSSPSGKLVYIPSSVWDIPAGNDYSKNTSMYSNTRKIETINFAFYWAKELGEDVKSILDIDYAASELERFFKLYQEKMNFVDKGASLTDKYKILAYLRGGTNGTAYGGGAMDSVGVMWIPSSRLGEKPFSVAAHELGHVFQYMVHANGAWGFSTTPAGSNGQAIFEMTSQYMLWQSYPDWMTFENWHVVAFMANTHLAFMHEDMRYDSPFVLEYWADKHGIDVIGKLWRQANKTEDIVKTYKRVENLTQQQFNDEMFDAARRFITWDIALIKPTEVNKYANQHTSELNAIGDGWYRISANRCPQNYGYNGIKLKLPAAGTKLSLSFKGIAGAAGYRSLNTAKAGWRYGFVAHKNDGSRVYSDIFSSSEGTAEFVVPEGTKFLWLVVSGAPTEHWEHLWDENVNNDEQWPYQIKLTGTSLDDTVIK